jgi:peptide/nickel transport system substrate-binding protein
MSVYNAPREPAKIRQMVKDAGYGGETVVLIGATDVPFRKAMAEVTFGMLRDAGFNVELQTLDWGAMVRRRENKGPIDKGGWNIAPANTGGIDLINPSGHAYRANGEKAWFGWPTSEKLEALRYAWIDAPDLAAQKKITDAMQRQWFIDVPMLQTGQWMQPTAHRADITDLLPGPALFWNVRRSV